jgi:cell division transport system permease protein
MSAWLLRHVQTMVGALGRLSAQPFATALTMLVIGIALALPACLHLFIDNAQRASASWNRSVELSIYLRTTARAEDAQRIASRLQQRRDLAEVNVVLADEALKQFRRDSGFGEALDALEENPLPHTITVTPQPQHATPDHLESLAAEIRQLPEVELVQLDTAWVQRLQAILNALRRAILVAASLLGLGVIVIVGNTIRLDIYNRRDEIEITKLLGASNGFVRRPFLYTGFWYGLGGGTLAAILGLIVLAVLAEPVARVAGLYGSDFRLSGLSARNLAALVLAGAVLGWLGSFLASSRHLREIQPR